MAANTAGPICEIVVQTPGLQFTSADTTTKKTLYTAGSNGGRVDEIFLSSNDTSQVNLQFYINDGATDFYIGVVAIPIGSGYTTVVRVGAMVTLSPVLGYLALKAAYVLKCSCLSTMTGSKTLDVVAQAGDF